jgi:hypothetical protein
MSRNPLVLDLISSIPFIPLQEVSIRHILSNH